MFICISKINENICDLHELELSRMSFACNANMCNDKMQQFFAHQMIKTEELEVTF